MNLQLFVGIWDRDVPVTGAGLMHRQAGNPVLEGVELMMCGALHPPVPPQQPPPLHEVDFTLLKAAAAVAEAAKTKQPALQQPAPSVASPDSQSSASALIISMLNPPLWLPSEISLLHLGAGWPVHGGLVDRLPPPPTNLSQPLRTTWALVPPVCRLADPLSWSPLEDERLAVESARAAKMAAAKRSEEAQRNMDNERRAAAKKRLQLAGAKVSQGMGRDAEPSTPEPLQQDEQRDGNVEDSLDQSHSAEDENADAFAEAGGALSVVEVGSFVLEDGWLVACGRSSIHTEFCNQLNTLPDRYCGTVANGMRHGRGIMLCNSGSSYRCILLLKSGCCTRVFLQ